MSLVALDGVPLLAVGIPNRQMYPSASALSSSQIATSGTSLQMIGQVFTEDGQSHTIDTTGSSSLGWRSGNVTFANGGTSVSVGLAAVDASNGPPARAANVSNAATFDVSAALVGGGGGITANSWQETVPTTGTKTIANGDTVAFVIQINSKAGSDFITFQTGTTIDGVPGGVGSVVTFNGSGYGSITRIPNAVITFNDGKRGYFYGGFVCSSVGTKAWNSGSSPLEYGNLIQLPFAAKAYGIVYRATVTLSALDVDAVLYSDPLGAPSALATTSVKGANIGGNGDLIFEAMFATPVSLSADTPYAAVLKPTNSASDLTVGYKTYGDVSHQLSESGGNGYAISRTSGAFGQQNSGLDRFAIGLLIGAFEGGGGASGGVSRARAFGGV